MVVISQSPDAWSNCDARIESPLKVFELQITMGKTQAAIDGSAENKDLCTRVTILIWLLSVFYMENLKSYSSYKHFTILCIFFTSIINIIDQIGYIMSNYYHNFERGSWK